ncbi:MAG: polysaccharide biosynthesis protein [Clostridia bacterium]|nr:polysaccharide biosynthesis protein [Clostridia bacterium]
MRKRVSIFVKNAAILTVTSLILRTVGMFFRVYMSGKIGAEGMGLYQLVFSIYVLGATFATSGISTAVTRLTADELVRGTAQSVRRILRRSVLLSLIIGLASTLLIYTGAELISAYWIKDMRAVPALKMLSFSLPSMGVSSCLRGYFVARRQVTVNSRAQLLEQAIRIAVVVLLINRFAAQGLAMACLAVMIGDTVAEWMACLCLYAGYLRDRRRVSEELCERNVPGMSAVIKRVLAIAVPITTGRYVNTILRTIENILVPNRIAAYCGSQERGLSAFGALKGMALPLIFFPASFLSAMSTLLIPEISSANALHQQRTIHNAVGKALRITLFSSILIGTVFLVFSNELGLLFYGNREVGIYLRVLAPLTPIMYTESIVDGILKGLNQQNSSLVYSVTDSSLRIVLIVLLVPRLGMGGFLAIMVFSNLLTSFLNVHRLIKVTGLTVPWERWALRPLLGAMLAAAVSLFITHLPFLSALPGIVLTVLGILSLCGTYLVLMLLMGCISRSELRKTVA